MRPRTIQVTREQLLSQREEILSRWNLKLEDFEGARCHCCIPSGIEISWGDFDRLGHIKFLLGGEA